MKRIAIIIAGGRDDDFRIKDMSNVLGCINELMIEHNSNDLTLITGKCSGIDKKSEEWWREIINNNVIEKPANWKEHGKAAGPIRNRKMARLAATYDYSVVIGIRGGAGTAGMMKLGKEYCDLTRWFK